MGPRKEHVIHSINFTHKHLHVCILLLTLSPSTERRPLRMHSLRPVPRTMTSYCSSMTVDAQKYEKILKENKKPKRFKERMNWVSIENEWWMNIYGFVVGKGTSPWRGYVFADSLTLSFYLKLLNLIWTSFSLFNLVRVWLEL